MGREPRDGPVGSRPAPAIFIGTRLPEGTNSMRPESGRNIMPGAALRIASFVSFESFDSVDFLDSVDSFDSGFCSEDITAVRAENSTFESMNLDHLSSFIFHLA